MRRLISIVTLLLSGYMVFAQFAPAVGLPGSTAMHYEDARFVEWADQCTVTRGWQHIGDTTLGKTTVGDGSSATGLAGENGVVSLGDGGEAVLMFNAPIYNGDGFDFAVFENGFPTGDSILAFLEFAFVEVSSDGQRFVRFPARSLIQDTDQLPMVGMDAALVNNLAGKYIYGYGTPFDLEEVKDSAGLDVSHITHVKLVDVIGSVDPAYGSYDVEGHLINDPYPTPFPSSGFDLDAVGIIHAVGVTGISEPLGAVIAVYPNPSLHGKWTLHLNDMQSARVCLYNVTGGLIFSGSATEHLQLPQVNAGIYMLQVESPTVSFKTKLIAE